MGGIRSISCAAALLWGGIALAAVAGADELPELRLIDERGRPVDQAVALIENARVSEAVAKPSTAVMDQADLEFVPQVIAIRTGTQVEFPNSDDTRHHVYSFSEAKTFELQLYRDNQAPPVLFEKVGLVVVGCNIHDSMRGYIYVAENALHGVSDAEGRITLPAYDPRGEVLLTLWHPSMSQSMSMAVNGLSADDSGRLTVTLPITLPEAAPESERSDLRNRLRRYNNDGG